MLQESLLDIVVERLEKLCGISQKKTEDQVQSTEEKKRQRPVSRPPGHKLNRTSYQDEFVQLMNLLSEVIRISNDHQQSL